MENIEERAAAAMGRVAPSENAILASEKFKDLTVLVKWFHELPYQCKDGKTVRKARVYLNNEWYYVIPEEKVLAWIWKMKFELVGNLDEDI